MLAPELPIAEELTSLESLPNVGPKLAAALRAAGIVDYDSLASCGAQEAWRRIHPTFDCLHSLFALEAAVRGVPKSRLDHQTRNELRAVALSISPGDC